MSREGVRRDREMGDRGGRGAHRQLGRDGDPSGPSARVSLLEAIQSRRRERESLREGEGDGEGEEEGASVGGGEDPAAARRASRRAERLRREQERAARRQAAEARAKARADARAGRERAEREASEAEARLRRGIEQERAAALRAALSSRSQSGSGAGAGSGPSHLPNPGEGFREFMQRMQAMRGGGGPGSGSGSGSDESGASGNSDDDGDMARQLHRAMERHGGGGIGSGHAAAIAAQEQAMLAQALAASAREAGTSVDLSSLGGRGRGGRPPRLPGMMAQERVLGRLQASNSGLMGLFGGPSSPTAVGPGAHPSSRDGAPLGELATFTRSGVAVKGSPAATRSRGRRDGPSPATSTAASVGVDAPGGEQAEGGEGEEAAEDAVWLKRMHSDGVWRWERYVDADDDEDEDGGSGEDAKGDDASGAGSGAGAGTTTSGGGGGSPDSTDPTGAAAVLAAGYVRGIRADGTLCWVPADEYGAFQAAEYEKAREGASEGGAAKAKATGGAAAGGAGAGLSAEEAAAAARSAALPTPATMERQESVERKMSGISSSSFDRAASLRFEDKVSWFRRQVQQLRIKYEDGRIEVHADRERPLQSVFERFRSLAPRDMRRTFRVKYKGEKGEDAGGLLREMMTQASAKLFDVSSGLFTQTGAAGQAYWINPQSQFANPSHLEYFYFAGRLIGKALLDGVLIQPRLSPVLHKHILGIPVSLSDMEREDSALFRSMVNVLRMDPDDLEYLCLTMSFDEEVFGHRSNVPLVPGGADIEVDWSNRAQYVQLRLRHRLVDSIARQLSHMLAGIYEIVPERLLAVFDHVELDLLLSGLPTVDVSDWKAHTEYDKCTASSKHVQWFWEEVEAMDGAERAKLLQIATGSSRAPAGGFARMTSYDNKPCKFTIRSSGDPIGAGAAAVPFPTFSTCYLRCYLPVYRTREQLRERLRGTLKLEIRKAAFTED